MALVFFREFQFIASISNDNSLSLDQDTNQFLFLPREERGCTNCNNTFERGKQRFSESA